MQEDLSNIGKKTTTWSMCLTFNKRNANYPNRISREIPSRSAQTYISRDFLARIHVLRSDSGERREKEKREKKMIPVARVRSAR